ncbi:hypothetical protein KKE78_02715 [Patescibacteria group bacterium]|nr:hypothetical protein [Patescibacteria group bacterium]
MNIKKILVGTAAGALMLGATIVPAFAKVATFPGPVEYGPWDLTGTCEIAYTGTNIPPGPYVHTYDLVSDVLAGTFSGDGNYVPNPANTEDIDGTVDGSNVEFNVIYTNINAGYTVNAEGVINPDGTLSGIAISGTGQTFSFASTESCAERDSSQFTGNHGQYVSSQDNKQEAAQSRVGMPVQSKGHTN